MFLQDAESAGAQAYENAAESIDDIPFSKTSDEAVFSKFEVSEDSVVLFKKVTLSVFLHCLKITKMSLHKNHIYIQLLYLFRSLDKLVTGLVFKYGFKNDRVWVVTHCLMCNHMLNSVSLALD